MGLFKKKNTEPHKAPQDGFYHLDEILEYNAVYNMIFGERSTGKTYACLYRAVQRYIEHGEQFAYIRRWDEDIKSGRAASIFSSIVNNGQIAVLTGGDYNEVDFYRGKFYLSKWEEGKAKRTRAPEPMGYAFALSTMEHDKSTSWPGVCTVIFDEFLTRTTYLVDEFVIFCNVLSTIIRDRDNVKVFMLGNTVNQWCPYFKEMGLKKIKSMQPGDINLYKYANSKLTVAVEYTGGSKIRHEKPSDFYFAFDNPNLSMITNGAWELGLYPHFYPHYNYTTKDIRLTYYIKFDTEVLRCDIIRLKNNIVTYIHQQTREINDEYKHLVFTTEQTIKPNYRVRIDRPQTELENTIWEQFKYKYVYYENNEVGDIVNNYLNWCIQAK